MMRSDPSPPQQQGIATTCAVTTRVAGAGAAIEFALVSLAETRETRATRATRGDDPAPATRCEHHW